MSDKKSKNLPKEKFVTIYETFFKAEDFTVKPANFWDELFLLRLNSNFIINEFKNLPSNEDLIKLKKNINFLYNKAIDYLKIETNPIRLHNIIHTLYLFTYSISVTRQIKLNSIETLEFLVGIDNAELKFQAIFDAIYSILTNEETSGFLKTISLKYLLALATQVENINDNLFMEYFMLNDNLFEAIIQIVSDTNLRRLYGRDAVLLLTLLLQYKKYDSANPYIVKLSILDDEMALTGLAMIMSSSFAEYNRIYSTTRKEQEGESSWWNNVGTLIGNMFIGDEEKRRSLKLDDSTLVVFYESVHLNRNFISTLTHAATEFLTSSSSSNSPSGSSSVQSASVATLPNHQSPGGGGAGVVMSQSNAAVPVPPSPSTPNAITPVGASIDLTSNLDLNANPNNMRLLNPLSLTIPNELSNDANSISQQPPTNPPSNLLVIFLQSCSAILQETKIETSNAYDTTKLFMLILVCISEDQYANSILHDSNVLYSVFLYQAKLRHRKLNMEKVPPSRQLACSVLDLMIEFIQSHLMKNFQYELYIKSFGIIQRLMCYQKKYRIRLDYNWQNLWNSLISTIKFLTTNESALLSKGHNLFLLYSKIIVIFNIFITYGDSFLPNAESYDYLYYDIMRMRQVFDNLLALLNRYVSSVEWKEHVIKLINQMANIKSILNHFTPKIDAWSTANHVSSLTEQQVLDIVRSNYETLTLKLEEDLDQYDRYIEMPFETSYFSALTKRIINDARNGISDLSKFDHVNFLSISAPVT